VSFHAHRINAGVRPAAASHVPQRVQDICRFVVERLGADRPGLAQPLGKAVDGDDAACAEQHRTGDRKQTDRTAAPHRDGIARLDAAIFRRHVAGRQHVRQKQHLLVGQ
jgi:hypothetical protein